jgi:hypothetical protein
MAKKKKNNNNSSKNNKSESTHQSRARASQSFFNLWQVHTFLYLFPASQPHRDREKNQKEKKI